jgi:hypothetical protein
LGQENTTHAKLATATFNTDAEDNQGDYEKVLRDLEEQGKRASDELRVGVSQDSQEC